MNPLWFTAQQRTQTAEVTVTANLPNAHTGGAVSLTDVATLRVGLAQMNPTVGDLAGNRALIADLYAQAVAAKCDIVAFTELSVTGYPPEDLALKPGFVRDNRIVVDDLAKMTGSCVAVIGFVDAGVGNQVASGRPVIYNAAAVCVNGSIQHVYHKRLLPNYDVFDEERTFEPGTGAHHLFEVGGVKCAVSICEDIWRADGPVQQQARDGAQLNININGSPFHSGKLQEREEMLRTRATDNKCAIVYVNQVGGQDELVFDGSSMVFDYAAHNKFCGFINYDIENKKNKKWSVDIIYKYVHFRSMPNKNAVIWINDKHDFQKLFDVKDNSQNINSAKEWFDLIIGKKPTEASRKIWESIITIIK